MFRQFQMIRWSEIQMAMAPCHGIMGPRHCISPSHTLHDIVEETLYHNK